MNQKIKSYVFSYSFYIITLILFILMLPTVLLPRKKSLCFPILWSKISEIMLSKICGLSVKIEGLENLPKTDGYIVASKHQSALETTVFHRIVPNTFYVLKKELMWLPLAGIYFLKTGCIPIDRKGGAKTMRKMLSGVQKRLAEGMNLIIFPEGTRTVPGAKQPYSPGVAFLYDQCHVPVVPVALNTGCFWGKNQTVKKPGVAVIRFLKPIEAGLPKREFLDTLYQRIETEQDKFETGE